MTNPPPTTPPLPTPADGRMTLMQHAIASSATYEWTVTALGPYTASLRRGKPLNHVAHALLSIFTCGLWLFVWLVLALTDKGVETATLTVDEQGAVWWTTAGQHIRWDLNGSAPA